MKTAFHGPIAWAKHLTLAILAIAIIYLFWYVTQKGAAERRALEKNRISYTDSQSHRSNIFFEDTDETYVPPFPTGIADAKERTLHPAMMMEHIRSGPPDSELIRLLKDDPKEGLIAVAKFVESIHDFRYREFIPGRKRDNATGTSTITLRPSSHDEVVIFLTDKPGEVISIESTRVKSSKPLAKLTKKEKEACEGVRAMVMIDQKKDSINGFLTPLNAERKDISNDLGQSVIVLADHIAVLEAFVRYAIAQERARSMKIDREYELEKRNAQQLAAQISANAEDEKRRSIKRPLPKKPRDYFP